MFNNNYNWQYLGGKLDQFGGEVELFGGEASTAPPSLDETVIVVTPIVGCNREVA